MPSISKITTPANQTLDIKDAVARNYLVYYVEGASTDTAGVWTGTCEDISSYYNGLTVIYKPAIAAASTTTLNINGLGAKTCYQSNATALTSSHFSVGVPIMFTYEDGYWKRADYNANTTTISNLHKGSGNYKAKSAVYRYQLLFHTDDDTLTPLNNSNNVTGTTKTMLTSVEFDPTKDIYYYYSTTNVAANGNITGTVCHYSWSALDMRYSFNITTTAFTAGKEVYLKLTINYLTGLAKINSASPLTQTLPTSNDGIAYLLLGRASSGYNMSLYSKHPICYHDGTELKQLVLNKPSFGKRIKQSSVTSVSAPTHANLAKGSDFNVTFKEMNGWAIMVVNKMGPSTTAITTTNNTLWSVPTGFAPSSTITGTLCYIYEDLAMNDKTACEITINADGTVQNRTPMPVGWYMGSVVYPIE